MKVKEFALSLFDAGFAVLPVALDGSKAPLASSLPGGKWRPWTTAKQSREDVEKAFSKPCAIGIIGGAISGNLAIIDFDKASVYEEWLAACEQIEPGVASSLPHVATPDGHHVYLRTEEEKPTEPALAKAKEKFKKPSGKETLVIIEIKARGGYVVGPGSPAATHESGKPYVHASGPRISETPTLTESQYEMLVSVARTFDQSKVKEERKRQPKERGDSKAGLKPGEDFDARATWDEILEPHGWVAVASRGQKTYWRRPGKNTGVSATSGAVETGGAFFTFSDNSPPFVSWRAYNKFSAYGLLNCNGDYSQASFELRAKGYGAPRQQRAASPSSKWDELQAPPPDDAPFPTEPEQANNRITASVLEQMLDNDPAAAVRDGTFERVLAMRTDRAEWVLISDVLRRKKQKRVFDAMVKDHDMAQKKRAIVNDERWIEKLIWKQTKDGDEYLDKCLANVIDILQQDPQWRGVIALDKFSNRITMRKETPFDRDEASLWEDSDLSEVQAWIERKYDIRPSAETVHSAIMVVAKRQSFNPLREYVDSLQERDGDSDGILDTWLIDFFGAPDTPLTRAIGAKWMISAIARAYNPGCKVDTMLILEGKQGLKKSRVLSQLVPNREWFADGLSDFGSKDQAVEIEGKWIIELAEMKGFGKEINTIKAFVTREAENYRPPYGRYTVRSPRKCIFAATVNPEEAGYLRDNTGNRRYWPISCSKQAPDMTPEVRDQLWAEAKRRYLQKEKWWFDDVDDAHLLAAAEEEQEKRVVQDIWQDRVESWLIGKDSVSLQEVAEDCLKLDTGRQDHNTAIRIGRVMRTAKWERWRPTKKPGEKQDGYRYRRPGGALSEQDEHRGKGNGATADMFPI